MKHYVCTLKARSVFPYIAQTQAKNKTAAARIFIKYLNSGKFLNARKSIGTVRATEVSQKHAGQCGVIIIRE